MSYQLSDAARAAKREYDRAWRARNKERISAYNRRYRKTYWERKAAEIAAEAAAKQEPPRS